MAYMRMKMCAVPQGSFLIMTRSRVTVSRSRCMYVTAHIMRKARRTRMRPGPNPPRQDRLLLPLEWEPDGPSDFVVVIRLSTAVPHPYIVAGFQIIETPSIYPPARYYLLVV